MCKYDGCKIQSVFNFEGQKKRLYCSLHKKDEMIDITDKTCIEKDCKTLSVFNFEGQKKGLYCSLHKKNGMINIKDKTCIEVGCKTIPFYNLGGQKKGLYCSIHKKNEMVDIINKTCIEIGCKTRPHYNFEGQKKGLYCSLHKKDEMIDVLHITCKNNLCYVRSQNKYEGYCLRCFIYTFPDKPVSRNYKTKETSVSDFVKSKYPNLTWITDKKIQNSCSKRRPDILLDLGYQILIIEIDENQHTFYDCSCDNKRMMEISKDLEHRPIIFIRFNPDEYINKDIKVDSCWETNKLGICVVKKNKKEEWNNRLESLENQINYWIEPKNKTNKTIETIQLFYDI